MDGILETMNAKIDALIVAQNKLLAIMESLKIDQTQINALNVKIDNATKALQDAIASYAPGS